MDVKIREKPRVFMDPKDWQKLLYYAEEAGDTEVTGLGRVERKDDDFYISDVFILGQRVSGASAEATEQTAQFVLELAKQDKNPSDYRFCWHSHVSMGAFWSNDDEETSTGFKNEFMISMVFNKRGEYKMRIDIFEPFDITVYDPPFQVKLADDEELRARVKKEVQEKVKKTILTYVRPRTYSWLNRSYGSGMTRSEVADEDDKGKESKIEETKPNTETQETCIPRYHKAGKKK